MNNRMLAGWSTGALAVLVGLLGASALLAAEPAPKNWKVPRTADGHPDLQGIWTNATITPLERPKEFGEAGAHRRGSEGDRGAERSVQRRIRRADRSQSEDAGSADELRSAASPARIAATTISGSIAAAKVITRERRAAQLAHHRSAERQGAACSPSGRNAWPSASRSCARTSTAPKSGRWPSAACWRSARAPARRCCRVLYNNHYQIVQNKDTVMILVEMVHDARIIHLDGKPLPTNVRTVDGRIPSVAGKATRWWSRPSNFTERNRSAARRRI